MADDRVCEQCRPLYSQSLIYTTIHTNAKQVYQAKLQGCQLCSLIHEGLTEVVKGDLEPDSIIVICPGIFRRPMEVLYGGSSTSKSIVLQFYVQEGIISPIPAIGFASDVSPDSTSATCLDFLRLLDRKCYSNHPECRSKLAITLPRRVIDLGPSWLDEKPKLYISNGEKAPYIALSHCWGKMQTCKTELATLEERTSGIDLRGLPKTFQDAIFITRSLGIRYIWIDSLCIIQDDRKDWATESAEMSKIYTNSYLTIAASSASSDECGFLGPRSNRTARTLVYKNGNRATKIQVREQILHDDSRVSTVNPLLTRAWAFQELLVSRRVVCYGSAEVQWYCLGASWCECDHLGGSSLSLNTNTLREQRRAVQPQTRTIKDRELGKAGYYHRWYNIIEAYSELMLTVSTDRLPALSALAQRFYDELNDIYVAGLWRGDIRRGLRWKSSWDQPAIGKLPQKYIAPTWSWASIEGKVFYERSLGQLSYEREDGEGRWTPYVGEPIHDDTVKVQCEFSSTNPFGEIFYGYLKLLGLICPAHLEVPEVRDREDEARVLYKIWPESESKPPDTNQWPTTSYRGFKPDVPLVRSWFTDEKGQRVQTAKRSSLAPGQPRQAISARVWVFKVCDKSFLVLVPSDWISGTYERIGFMTGEEEWEKNGVTERIIII